MELSELFEVQFVTGWLWTFLYNVVIPETKKPSAPGMKNAKLHETDSAGSSPFSSVYWVAKKMRI